MFSTRKVLSSSTFLGESTNKRFEIINFKLVTESAREPPRKPKRVSESATERANERFT